MLPGNLVLLEVVVVVVLQPEEETSEAVHLVALVHPAGLVLDSLAVSEGVILEVERLGVVQLDQLVVVGSSAWAHARSN